MRKSKLIFGALSLILAGAMIFTGCNHDPVEPEVTTYTVTFDTDGGSGIDSVTVKEGETVAKPENPTREGYTFGTWKLGEVDYDFDEVVTEDITLKATWSEITYKITFNSNGGSEVAEATVKYGEKVTLPEAPTKEGAFFAGWFTDEALTVAYTDAAIKADTVLYAKWSTDPVYTITLNYNYEGSTDSSVTAIKENEYKVAAPTGEREDYELEGWYSDAECTTPVDFATAFSANTTIYAKWKRVYSLKDEEAGKYNVYFVKEGTTATETKTFTNGAVAAFLTTKNNGDAIVLNVNADGSAAASKTYEKITVKFDYEVAEWSDSNVTPKFKLESTDAIATQYFDGKVEGGKIEKTVNLTGDITSIKLGFNAYKWEGAETDRIKVIVREVTLEEKKAFDLGDETEGSYTLNFGSTTATQKKVYSNGAVAALLETTSNGSDLTFKVTDDGNSVKSDDYASLKITFDYEKVNWESEQSAKFRITCDGIEGLNNSHTEYFENASNSGTIVKTIPMLSGANFSTVKIGFNAYKWEGSSKDSIKIVVRKIELVEKVAEVEGDKVALTKDNVWKNGASYGDSYSKNGVSYVSQYEYGGGGYVYYIDASTEDVNLSEKYSSIVLDFTYEASWDASKDFPVKFAVKCWKKSSDSFYSGAVAIAYPQYNEKSGTIRLTIDTIPENSVYNTIALCSGYLADSNADGDDKTTDTVKIILNAITFVKK